MTYWYDDAGRLKRVMDEQGGIRTYNYDAVGNILSIEAGDGGCPAVAPTVASITPNTCKAGTTCEITVTGGSLLGGTVASSLIDASVTHCQEVACDTITCRLSPSPFMAPGPVTIRVTTPLGLSESAVQIDPPANVGQPGQTETWHFSANAQTVVTLRMTRLINQHDGTSTLDPVVELRDSRDFLLVQDDDTGSDLPTGPGRNAVIQSFSLPATDTYRVVARGKDGTYGTYILEIEPSSIALIPESDEPRQPDFVFTGTLPAVPVREAPDLTFAGMIASPSERDAYSVSGNAGVVTTLEVNRVTNQANGGGSLDPEVELRDSRGFLLGRDDDTGTSLPPGPGHNALILNYVLPATDTYSVVVSGADGTTGPYEINVTFGELTAETDANTFAFPANAGGLATIHVDRVANSPDGSGTLDPTFELRDSRGVLLGRDDETGTGDPPGPGHNAALTRVRLPATDTYSITVRGSGGTLGPFRVEVFLDR